VWWYPVDVPLVLASGSPRRRSILEMVGIPFEQVVSGVTETPMDAPPSEVVRHWAVEKAKRVLPRSKGRPVLGADTMVVLDGDLLGKPGDGREAAEMLGRLSGRTHSVFGGVAVFWPERGMSIIFHEETRVTFRILDETEIAEYVETGEPMDKAGAYAIQGLGALLVDGMEGCFFNVMGLPVSRLALEFREYLYRGRT